VILDANGEKATVTEVIDATSTIGTAYGNGTSATVHGYSETVKPVCIAPCVVDMKPGMHVLRFASPIDERESAAGIQIGDRSKVVRHAMGHTDSWSLGHFAAEMLVIFGASSLVTGGIVYGAMAGTDEKTQSVAQPYALGFTAGGAIALLVGVPLMILTRPVHQPGATTEMTLNK
jgi:hypothetical protein